jgi:DNA-binding NarL/FixJ family response regulator
MGDGCRDRDERIGTALVKAIVADDWSVLRGGVAAVLAQCGVPPPMHAATGTEAVAAAEQNPVDLVVLGAVPDVTPPTAISEMSLPARSSIFSRSPKDRR